MDRDKMFDKIRTALINKMNLDDIISQEEVVFYNGYTIMGVLRQQTKWSWTGEKLLIEVDRDKIYFTFHQRKELMKYLVSGLNATRWDEWQGYDNEEEEKWQW